ncbi:MAG: helix-turn-helix domain-containing protein [Pseudomonadota bacterium]
MSHKATNWAVEVRGIKPVAKIVLWHLANRMNPDFGCFVSQERLARDCEISRATLNRHLDTLEEAGLITRRQRKAKGKRQATTMYFLDFDGGREGDFPGKQSGEQSTCSGEGSEENSGGDEAEILSESGCESAPETGNFAAKTDLESGPASEDASEKRPAALEIPCPESGHGVENGSKPGLKMRHGGAETVSQNSDEPGLKNGESRVSKRDSNPVREPVREPVTLSSTVSDEARGVERENSPVGEKALDEDTEPVAADHSGDGIRTERDADRDKRFWAAFREYPRFQTSSKRPAWQAWLAAGADVRARVTPDRVNAFLALCKRDGVNHPPAISTVLREGLLFTDAVDALLVKATPAEEGGDDGRLRLAPWSKEWMIVRLSLLKRGAQPGFDDLGDLTRQRRRFPLVYQMDHGPRLEVERAKLPKDAVAASVQIGVTHPDFLAWQAFHEWMDWPPVPKGEALKSAWFPCRTPEDWKYYAACVEARQQQAEQIS